jgi:hypothetical protein
MTSSGNGRSSPDSENVTPASVKALDSEARRVPRSAIDSDSRAVTTIR